MRLAAAFAARRELYTNGSDRHAVREEILYERQYDAARQQVKCDAQPDRHRQRRDGFAEYADHE